MLNYSGVFIPAFRRLTCVGQNHLRSSVLALSLGLLSSVGFSTAGVAGQVSASATVQEILDGKELFIDEKPARVGAIARAPQRLSTGASRGQITFGKGAAGRLNRYTQLRLGQSCFLLRKGQILVSGGQDGCTTTNRFQSAGTNYILAVNEDGSSDLTVLEGRVLVEQLRDEQPIGQPQESVSGGTRVRLDPDGKVAARQTLTPSDVQQIQDGPLFREFRAVLPAQAKLNEFWAVRSPNSPRSACGGEALHPLAIKINSYRESKGLKPLCRIPAQLAQDNATYLKPLMRSLLASDRCDHFKDAFDAFQRRMVQAKSSLIPTSELISCPHSLVEWDQVLAIVLKDKSHYDLLLNRPRTTHIDCVEQTAAGERMVMCTLWSPAR